MEEIIINSIEVLGFGLSIGYLFCQTHQLKMSLKRSYITFYLFYIFFFLLSLPFFNYFFIWIGYFSLSLFIISHICFKESLKKRMMMLGVLGLIYMIEEMVTTIFSFTLFHNIWYDFDPNIFYLTFKACFSNIQMIVYCFIVTKVISRQLNHLKQFYFIPLGQGILLLILFYLGVLRCHTILGYILIVLTLLMMWCDYVLYHTYLKIREEKITNIKFVQSEIFTEKQNNLRKLRHDMLNHILILSTMIENNQRQEAEEYMEKVKKSYELMEDDHNDI